jgi:hypothetical protein
MDRRFFPCARFPTLGMTVMSRVFIRQDDSSGSRSVEERSDDTTG